MKPRITGASRSILVKAAISFAVLASVVLTAAAPARADWDDWHHDRWRHHEWREHEWREHYRWRWSYYHYQPHYYGYYYSPYGSSNYYAH